MPTTLISTSDEQYYILEEKMHTIANISFPSNLADIPTIDQDTQAPEESSGIIDSIDAIANTVCPKMLNELLKRTYNTSVPRLDGFRWKELNIWFKLDLKGLC
jgi:hypothetical protein